MLVQQTSTATVQVDTARDQRLLRTTLDALLHRGATTIHVRIGADTRPDVRCWGVLVGAARRARERGGELVVTVGSAECDRHLRRLGLATVLNLRS